MEKKTSAWDGICYGAIAGFLLGLAGCGPLFLGPMAGAIMGAVAGLVITWRDRDREA